MFDNTFLVVFSQIPSITSIKGNLIKLKKFLNNRKAANDESLITSSEQLKSYSIEDLMTVLNISTTKEVQYLIKKLELQQPKYRNQTVANKWMYNNKARDLLESYIRFQAS